MSPELLRAIAAYRAAHAAKAEISATMTRDCKAGRGSTKEQTEAYWRAEVAERRAETAAYEALKRDHLDAP